VLPSSQNWELTYNYISFSGNNLTTNNGTVIFDINVPYIVLPNDLYISVVQGLSTQGLNCTFYQVGQQSLSSFCAGSNPTPSPINFFFSGMEVSVPASVYYNSATQQLLFVPSTLVPNQTALGVTPGYENKVIFGLPVMNYFYVVYDFQNMTNTTITLYESYQGIFNSAGAAIIGASTLVLMTVICCCGCCYYHKRKLDKSKRELERNFLKHKAMFNMDESKFI
jgi:hypothetical protein